ncbi:hypothetical protein SDC9_167549 [bioreactor metagenome]|uniref:Uncharacterized protein n=1 Tax=bioreactor metagenome TaxID=1076179 RepID=A0A645G2K1_9ZZZZ
MTGELCYDRGLAQTLCIGDDYLALLQGKVVEQPLSQFLSLPSLNGNTTNSFAGETAYLVVHQ